LVGVFVGVAVFIVGVGVNPRGETGLCPQAVTSIRVEARSTFRKNTFFITQIPPESLS